MNFRGIDSWQDALYRRVLLVTGIVVALVRRIVTRILIVSCSNSKTHSNIINPEMVLCQDLELLSYAAKST